MLVSHYRYVVVDASSRLDATTRLVANLSQSVLLVTQTDVNSLWSAARVQQFLAESGKRERIGLVLNRFRKMSGFTEADAASSVGIKLLWKVPNQFSVISTAIERGIPVMQQGGGEIAQGFHAFAAHLTENDVDVKRATWSLFKSV
jgi:CO dehydrogenase nickel-insertion accessory protein CooC1